MPQESQVRVVKANPRLHLGLLDCGDSTLRQFGGVSMAINGLHTEVSACLSNDWSITFAKTTALSPRTYKELDELLMRLSKKYKSTSIHIKSTAPEHMGLGSKTTLFLSIALVTAQLSDEHYTNKDVVKVTGRGGTSGAGINLFWHGGLIVDAGHNTPPGERNFAPSSARTPSVVPIINARSNISKEWRIALFFDPAGKSIEGTTEKEIFASAMPIPEIDNLRALAAVYHGVLPAVREHDLVGFARALSSLNQTGMKAIELSYQTNATKQFLKLLWNQGMAAGLSSFGPVVFVIVEEDQNIAQATVAEVALQCGLSSLGVFSPINVGASILQA